MTMIGRHRHPRQGKFRRRPGLSRSRREAAAFTLVEVILAVVIVVGMMVVVLYFYSQAADLRAQLLRETERLAAARLVMDRLTSELRTACRHPSFPQGFVGSADSLQFIKTDVPSRSAWGGGSLGRVEVAQTDLKWVRYSRAAMQEGTNMVSSGLVRTEEPLVEARSLADMRSNVLPEAEASAGPEPLTTEIQYLRFRFWDGSKWLESWSSAGLPKSVEVSLGFEAPPAETVPGEAAEEGEVFRRIIFLPGSTAGEDTLVVGPEESLPAAESANDMMP